MVDASGSTSYTYDALNRLTNKVVNWTGGKTVTLTYQYDALGSLTNLCIRPGKHPFKESKVVIA
jgi:YD repeat-containing protein